MTAVIRTVAYALIFASLLSACVSPPRPQLSRSTASAADGAAEEEFSYASERENPPQKTTIDQLQPPPDRGRLIDVAADLNPGGIEAKIDDIRDLVPDETIQVALPAQALPEFIDTVFGVLLEVPYSLGPGVAERRELVSLRGSQEVSKPVFFSQVQTALRDYGLIVVAEDGAVRILQSDTLAAGAPIFIRSRSSSYVPESSRPVLQFFELRSVQVNSILELLEQAFPDTDRVAFSPRQTDNTLVIAGNASDVAAAARVVAQIDQPRFAGGLVARIEPVFWSAEKLSAALVRVLSTEGFQIIAGNNTVSRAITIVPLETVNQILVFSTNREGYQRALYWVNELDRPTGIPDEVSIFTYRVQNTDADSVGQILIQALSDSGAGGRFNALDSGPQGQGAGGPNRSADSRPGVASGITTARLQSGARITVDRTGNRILFQGTAAEYARVRDLLIELDEPPAQALIEVTIAEVTLTDSTSFGVEFEARGNDPNTVTSTLGSFGLTSGFDFDFIEDDVRVALSALATNNNVNVLSTPRIMARSGQAATINVGTDIPTISSQRATQFSQVGDGTDVLQSVTYRQTGVILEVEPVIYGDNRIDLIIKQEVSNASADAIPGISSPVISNRSINTQIALREGTTAVLGGLIQDDFTRAQSGIPVLKDLPLIGNFFRSLTIDGTKTELLLFVTPYIMRTDDQIARASDILISEINASLEYSRGSSYTLNPFARQIGPTLPSKHDTSLGAGPAQAEELSASPE